MGKMIDADYLREVLHVGAGDCERCDHDAQECLTYGHATHAICEAIRNAPDVTEPHVMTLDEAENALDTVVWVDRPEFDNSSDEYALLTAYSRKQRVIRFRYICGTHEAEVSYNAYGKRVRFWNLRPTDEQREAVKWDG